jgi:hypothetical protein
MVTKPKPTRAGKANATNNPGLALPPKKTKGKGLNPLAKFTTQQLEEEIHQRYKLMGDLLAQKRGSMKRYKAYERGEAW